MLSTRGEVLYKFSTRNFTVRLDIQPDGDIDLSWDETGEVARDIEYGRLEPFVARVRVTSTAGVLGASILGGCLYRDPNDFVDHREVGRENRELEARGESARVGSYFHDMVHEAIDEARGTLRAMRNIPMRV